MNRKKKELDSVIKNCANKLELDEFKELCRKALFSIGKFGFFRQKIQYCNLCYGNGNISIEVLLDLQVDCRTFH